ncbi:DUF1460 domain-containing protein [Nocardia sp. NPDC127579]|uniref:DUF1460 domain-containing protein n=1 Tax=Nocardia sp. NPDC127579 TaxID=3345402 RepID=UPI00363E9FA3
MRSVLLILAALVAVLAPSAQATPAVDDYTAHRIDELLTLRNERPRSTGELLDVLSSRFLGTPYGANMLIGSPTRPEELVVDFRRVDCFTYLDYVQALSRSATSAEFTANLIETRYAAGTVDYQKRKHFFTDWAAAPRVAATDITGALSPHAVPVTKRLNAKADGGQYLPGIPVVDRPMTYIPAAAVDEAFVAKLRTGDYLGAYTDQAGLDVTHVGIFVMTPNGPVFRNASSLEANNQVVDSPLYDYARTVPGLIVLRPL